MSKYKLFLLILSLLVALSIRSTEVFVCNWKGTDFSCDLISERPKEPLEPDPFLEIKKEEDTDEDTNYIADYR